MMRTIFALIAAGLVGFGMQAVADNTADQQQKAEHKQFMKDCMEKARAAHTGMSEQDMKKSCMDQWKSSMGNPDKPITPAH
jgi:Na+-translocating ferredoxin:NAD+ oxidoreductase RnfG subunit